MEGRKAQGTGPLGFHVVIIHVEALRRRRTKSIQISKKEPRHMKKRGLHIGLRTIKTALAIIIAMVAAGQFGGTSDKRVRQDCIPVKYFLQKQNQIPVQTLHCGTDLPAVVVGSPENRKRLEACCAKVRDKRELDSVMELDVVTNFHETASSVYAGRQVFPPGYPGPAGLHPRQILPPETESNPGPDLEDLRQR